MNVYRLYHHHVMQQSVVYGITLWVKQYMLDLSEVNSYVCVYVTVTAVGFSFFSFFFYVCVIYMYLYLLHASCVNEYK